MIDTVSSRSRGTVLVTGAAGFLGGHFALWWRKSGGRVVALVRADDDAAARLRILQRQSMSAAAYDQAPPREHDSIAPLVGDLGLPLCGVAPARLDELCALGIDTVWHFAANLRFEQGRYDEVMSSNVNGTANAMDLAVAVGARRFIYISTAYSCGAANGPVREDLHPIESPFNNAYEESKCRAEHLVISRSSDFELSSVVLRPSIVVGPSVTWRPGGSEFGLYGLLNKVLRLRGLPPDRHSGPIMVQGNPAARLHLIPVDVLMRDCLDLEAAGFPGGPVYHLTSLGGPMIGEGAAVVCDILRLPSIHVGAVSKSPSGLEKWLARQLSFYSSYLTFTGSFVRSLAAPITLDLNDLERLVAGYAASRDEAGASMESMQRGAGVLT